MQPLAVNSVSPVAGEAGAAAEIAEILWIDPHDTGAVELAPLTRDHILPLVLDRG